MSEEEEGVVGTAMSPTELAAQRRQLKEYERQQQGRASQSTRAGDWRANYAFDDLAVSGTEEARSGSAAHGRAAGRSRPQHRSGARSASPPRSPRSPTYSQAMGEDGGDSQGFTVVEPRSRSRRGRPTSTAHGTAGVALPAQARSASASAESSDSGNTGSESDGVGNRQDEKGDTYYRHDGRKCYGHFIWCPVCSRPLRSGCLECLYPDCHQMLTYDVGDATETVEDHRQEAAVAAATGLADVYGAAVRGGLLPVVRGTRGKHEVFE
ncbi:MAG: hypothetical protein GY772_13315, partial [bacterium]|nr:hypothetical protein [bacterium]